MIAQSESSIVAHARKDATTTNAEIITLAYKLTKDGPDTTTLRQLANLCELLAIRLESYADARHVELSLHRGSYCRSIRQRYNLSQRDVARLAGIDDKTVRDIEACRSSTNVDTMLRMSYALKTPAAKLWPSLNSVPGGVS